MGALIHHPPLSGYRPQHLALVLVVDDDSDLRQLTARILVLNGYDVIEAGDGRIGLGCLAESIPDLVILDLHMPVMDGWAFRAEQQDLADRRLADIPILLLTGEEAAADHAHLLHAAGLVQKPYDPEELLIAVNAVLRGRD
jgi:DNA-binding response OmpR family regulator